MKQKILIILLVSIMSIVAQAQEFDIVTETDSLQRRLSTVLRGLTFPGTIGSEAVAVEIPALHDRLLAWKSNLQTLLESAETIEVEGHKLPLTDDRRAFFISRYFTFVSYLIRINKLVTGRSNWQVSADKFDLRVPPSLLWSQSPTMLTLFKQMIVSEMQDGLAILRLNPAFVDGLQAVVLANEATVDSHREVVKYSLYSRLYRQLVQNEHYRGESVDYLRKLPQDFADDRKYQGYELELRQAIVDHHRLDHQKIFMRASLVDSYPRIKTPTQRLKRPFISNWHLYEDLRAEHPNLTTFTTTQLAERIYPLLSSRQRQSIATTNSKQFRQFMLLAEHVFLVRELSKALQNLNIDGSSSRPALRQLLVKAKMNALLAGLMQLRINDRQKLLTLAVAMQRRERQLLASEGLLQEVDHWYDKARQGIDSLRVRSRQELIKDLLFISWKVDRIETSASEPINMHILNRSLRMQSFVVSDFSGEFQQSFAAILQTNGYLASKGTFLSELSKYLNRLGQQQVTPDNLKGLTVDELTNRYLEPALAQATPTSNPVGEAVYRKVNISHLAQLKSFIQYGYWFGYFASDQKKIPTIDDLPLSDQQKKNYFKELKFSYFDRYPFLLLKIAKQNRELYLVLAENVKDLEDVTTLTNEDLEEFWPIILQAIYQQRDRIIDTIADIDRADSVQDIKHVVGNSPTVDMALKEFAGLYPLHEKFVELYHKPSKFRHNWEKIDFEYIGGMFNVFIAHLVGGWLLRKTVVTSYPLRYLTPMFGSAVGPYMQALEWAWGVILVDFFILKPVQAFIINPQKVNATRDYYYLGNQQDQFFSRTHIDYLDRGNNADLLNYAFEASMMGIFVGMYGVHIVQRKFFGNAPRLLPYLRERRLRKDLDRLGLSPKPNDSSRDLAQNFSGKYFAEISSRNFDDAIKHNAKNFKRNIIDVAKNRIKLFKEKIAVGDISKGYGKAQIRQIELARDRVIRTIDRKLTMWEAISIEHDHNFATIGMMKPTYQLKDVSEIYNRAERKIKAGVIDFKSLEELSASRLIMDSLSRLIIPVDSSSKKEINRLVRRFSNDDQYGKDLDFFGLPRNKRSSFEGIDNKTEGINKSGAKAARERLTKAEDHLFKAKTEGYSYHQLLVEGLFHRRRMASNNAKEGDLVSELDDIKFFNDYFDKHIKSNAEELERMQKRFEKRFSKKLSPLTPESSKEEIEWWFRTFALRTHPDKLPDKHPDKEGDVFIALQKAYQRLVPK